MYDLLSADAQSSIARDAFVRRYTNIHAGIGETKVSITPGGAVSDKGELPFTVVRDVALFGQLSETNSLPLVPDANATWKVAWQPSLIFNQLTANTSVRVTPDVPKRGRILDRSGKPLADNGAILSVGVVPGQIQD